MLRRREEWEAVEKQTLAPYAMHASDSCGRRFSEPSHPMRTEFQRDRDRVIHSAAFRRLEYKTQVFVNHEGDYYRTRLTHTLETAQITRTIARILGLNPDLAEAVALAHDLGHPPFGHAGEKTLNDLMRAHGGFDHNAQSLRTVDWLEQRYPPFPGLNLTYEVREGIIKHSAFKGRAAAQEFDAALYPCLEAQIVDFADEIAYLAHDVDDGVKAQMLTRDHLEGSRLFREARSAAVAAYQADDERMLRYQTVGRMINLMVTDLVTNVDAELTARRISTVEQIRHAGKPLAGFGPALGEQVKELRQIMRDRLYRHYRVSRMTEKAGRVLARLFEAFMTEPRQLPDHVLARGQQESLARVIADYIAGMTDRFALDEYRKLFDPDERV